MAAERESRVARMIRRAVERLDLERPLAPVVRAVRADSLTYLNHANLNDLWRAVEALEAAGRPGILIEAGCAAGGSAIVMATAKTKARRLYVYDVFGMIPPPSANDGADVHQRYALIQSGRSRGLGPRKYYGYEENLLEKVTQSFARHGVPLDTNNICLVKGLFYDTIHPSGPVALAHLDGDWYESVRTCLERIEPHLVPGGVLVIDDYDNYSGCRSAVDEYFRDRGREYEFIHKSRLHIVRR
jgi:macrocin-O-methyltransferase TylF-like protien